MVDSVDVDDVDEWLLSPEEHDLVKGRAGATRLGFALMLRFFDLNGWFPRGPGEIGDGAVSLVAAQVGVGDPALFGQYRFEGRSFKAHRAVIRYREVSRATT